MASLLLGAPCCAAEGGTSPYRRAGSSRQLSLAEIGFCSADSAAPCESEQVHIQLGGPGAMVVTFASASEAVASSIEYWESTSNATAPSLVAHGTKHAYSQLIYVEDYLFEPQMGRPAAEVVDEVLAMQDTQAWTTELPIYPHKLPNAENPYTKMSSYFNATESMQHRQWPEGGLGAYKNPGMIYNSPVIHTVTLQALSPGTRYTYRVAGSPRTFNFTYPPDHVAFADGGGTAAAAAAAV